jgi:hypothetical protein
MHHIIVVTLRPKESGRGLDITLTEHEMPECECGAATDAGRRKGHLCFCEPLVIAPDPR